MTAPKVPEMIARRLAAQNDLRMSRVEALLVELRSRSMTTPDMAAHLAIPTPSARNLRELMLEGLLIVEAGRGVTTTRSAALYAIDCTEEEAAAFCAAMRANESLAAMVVCQRPPPPPAPGTHIYMAGDETNRTPRNAKVQPRRHWMDVALFGPAQGAAA